MAGDDPDKIEQLPNTEGMRNEIIVHRCARFFEDIAIQAPGAVIVEMGDGRGATDAQLAEKINDRTAAILTQMEWGGMIPVGRMVELAHARSIPVIVDAAFDVPPKANFWRYTKDLGADAVIISGGKGIRGPQTTGLVLGRKSIIDACIAHGNPNRGIGRTMKVGKEEMAGIYAAVKYILNQDEDAVFQDTKRMGNHIRKALSSLPTIKSVKRKQHAIFVEFAPEKAGLSGEDIGSVLLEGEPSILAWCREGQVRINLATLQEGEEELIVQRLQQLLS